LREKIVAQNSGKLVIIADTGKRVSRLGTHAPLPVEVAAFGHELHESFLTSLGCRAALRKRADGSPLVTDNHNLIYDCRFDGIDDPSALEARLKRRAGVIETGLFLAMASVALIGTDTGVETFEQKHEPAGKQ
jgi:ribose 5-phosphate isomerase A